MRFLRFTIRCYGFLGIAAGVPFLLWAALTGVRLLLLPTFIVDKSLWYHSLPFFAEFLCFIFYAHGKESEFDSASPMMRRDTAGRPLAHEPGQATRYATFQLTWLQEAKNDCRLNLLLLVFGTPITFLAVIVTAYFLPEWGITNLLTCSGVGFAALRILLLAAEKRGLEHGMPPLSSDHSRVDVKPARFETRGKGLATQEQAQELWLKYRRDK